MAKPQPTENRKTARRKRTTKAELLRKIAASTPPESFLPAEAWAVMFGTLAQARWAARKAWIRSVCDRLGMYCVTHPIRAGQKVCPAPRPPSSSLSRLNCSRVCPPLVFGNATQPTSNIGELRSIIEEGHRCGQPWPKLLDLLATSSGLSWPVAGILLEKTLGFPISQEEILPVAQARRFWNLYAEGRACLVALQAVKEVPVWGGDWAYFDHEQLPLLLPGLILPDHCQRAEYLTNYISLPGEEALDLFSLSGQALCRHPFRSYLNPLRVMKLDSTLVIDI